MIIVAPHRIVSRECRDSDARRIAGEAERMREHFGIHTVALAHPQVEDKEPLRFFVLAEPFLTGTRNTVIVNPKITRHSNYSVESVEGCHTYIDRPHTKKLRWRIVEVEYQVLQGSELSPVIREKFTGILSNVFQHEIDHLDAKYCYDHE